LEGCGGGGGGGVGALWWRCRWWHDGLALYFVIVSWEPRRRLINLLVGGLLFILCFDVSGYGSVFVTLTYKSLVFGIKGLAWPWRSFFTWLSNLFGVELKLLLFLLVWYGFLSYYHGLNYVCYFWPFNSW